MGCFDPASKVEGELPAMYSQQFDNLMPLIDLFTNSSDVLPELLGFNQEKHTWFYSKTTWSFDRVEDLLAHMQSLA